jgi:dihydrofolate reductase
MKQRKVVLYIAQSLDGYIAKNDDSLDWLMRVDGEGDNGYADFLVSVDTILIGRKTYDQILILAKGKFPYPNKSCFVFSRSEKEDTEFVKFINEDVRSFTKKLKNEEGKDIWVVGGGELISPLIKERLIDELIITIAPTLIGKGVPLFREAEDEVEVDLTLKEMKRFNQFAQLHYTIKV